MTGQFIRLGAAILIALSASASLATAQPQAFAAPPASSRAAALVPDMSSLTQAQQDALQIIDADMHRVTPPFALLLNAPFTIEGAVSLRSGFRNRGSLEPRHTELMVMVVARHWNAHFAWKAHEDNALAAGVSEETLERIQRGRRPHFARSDDALVYRLVVELLQKRRIKDRTFEQALAALGRERLVELVAGAGFYSMVCMVLAGFDPDGALARASEP